MTGGQRIVPAVCVQQVLSGAYLHLQGSAGGLTCQPLLFIPVEQLHPGLQISRGHVQHLEITYGRSGACECVHTEVYRAQTTHCPKNAGSSVLSRDIDTTHANTNSKGSKVQITRFQDGIRAYIVGAH